MGSDFSEALNFLPSLQGYGSLLLLGLWRTVFIAMFSFGFGLVIGLSLAIISISSGRGLQFAIGTFTTLARALPELILILLLYYAFSDAISWGLAQLGFGHVGLDGIQTAIIVLALVSGAYSTEVFRAAIAGVPKGMVEAGESVGMGKLTCFRRIIFPVMLPMALPGLSNVWLMVVKGTSLVSIVGVTELALAAQQGASATKAYFTVYFAALILYLILALLSLRLLHHLELYLRRGQVAV